VRKVWSARTARRHLILALVGLALAVPALLRLAGWLPGPAIYMPMRLLFVAPFFVLIVACGIISIGDARVRRAALATAIAIQAVSLFNYYTCRQWTNWALVVPMREVICHIEENEQPGDVVVLDEWNLYDGPFFYWNGIATVHRYGGPETGNLADLPKAPRIWVVRAMRDSAPGRPMDKLLDLLKPNFFLQEQIGYVSEPPAILQWKRRLLRREVFPHKIESLLFRSPPVDDPPLRRDETTTAPLAAGEGLTIAQPPAKE
jgi:hypothetical protein